MGADYYETDTDKSLLLAKGSVPIGIGKNSHIKKAIIDKNARIGDNVKGRIEMVVALSNPTNGPLNANEVITDISDLVCFSLQDCLMVLLPDIVVQALNFDLEAMNVQLLIMNQVQGSHRFSGLMGQEQMSEVHDESKLNFRPLP
ncbi:hypothetical protein Vadar_033096 [Vaccinium darrowii]|uniref:Uncharacterized protein n=1 Tax=Vaccinium darrowii TaxID=229202 RepID=A0ACB7ZN69_9ERIC|nr:hypothetical protein Vadar_033096 [Vaccinium darrowii]